VEPSLSEDFASSAAAPLGGGWKFLDTLCAALAADEARGNFYLGVAPPLSRKSQAIDTAEKVKMHKSRQFLSRYCNLTDFKCFSCFYLSIIILNLNCSIKV